MSIIEWDKPGDRFYQSGGLDRGVLYLKDSSATSVPWNGLISVEEVPEFEIKQFYMDGLKYLISSVPGDFQGKLKAFTYPDEFDQVNGIGEPQPGLSLYDQPLRSFNLTYRTKVNNALWPDYHSYKIHLLYNIIALPESYVYETITEGKYSAIAFGWTLIGRPQSLAGYRPTAHISIHSADIGNNALQSLEEVLYGTESTAPAFPTIDEVVTLLTGGPS